MTEADVRAMLEAAPLHSLAPPAPEPQPAGLRPYQSDVIAAVQERVAAGVRRTVIVAPTGSGKTVIAADIVRTTVAAGGRVLFLCHRRELVMQSSAKLHAVGVDHGVVLAGWPTRPGAPVQVASIATLYARAVRGRAMETPPADLIVVDEAHHARARTWAKILDAYPDAVVIGLTATPCRGDGRGLGNLFESLVECPDVAELTRMGFLVPSVVYAPSTPDLAGVRTERGDYVESALAQRMDRSELVGDIVSHWNRLAVTRRTVVFATGVGHSVHLRDEFRRAGNVAEHIDGTTPAAERDAILAKLDRGEIEIVTNAQVLTEGWDCPAASCVVLARPTKQLGLFRQMVGRILRPAPGKRDALILDHAGAVHMHGLPDDKIHWTLEVDRKAENETHASRNGMTGPRLTTCPKCSHVRNAGEACPACGFRPQARPEYQPARDENLVRINPDGSRADDRNSPAERDRWLAELTYIAQEREYKSGWAAYKFKEKFGAWPPRGHVRARPASPEVLSWVRSRNIAWAKAKEKSART